MQLQGYYQCSMFGFRNMEKIYLKLITSWDAISGEKKQHRFTVWEQIFNGLSLCARVRTHTHTHAHTMKCSFFLAAVVSILLYGCTTWTLTKRLKKKLDGNYTRMLRAILNKSWRQHPTRHQLYGHLPPITKTIQVRRTRHAGHCWRSKDELISDVLL